jgi:hypothetical protein
MADEPFAVSDGVRRHFESCESCRNRQADMLADARVAAALLEGPEVPLNPAQALARFRREAVAGETSPRRSPFGRLSHALSVRRQQLTAPIASAAALVALVGGLTLTPAGSWAQSFIQIFQPTQITVLPVSAGELKTLPNLRRFGTIQLPSTVNAKAQQYTSLSQAETAAGTHVAAPSSLPSSVPSTVSYTVSPGGTGSFTFSAAKAAKWAASKHKTLPPMPARINGSTLQVSVNPVVGAMYGSSNGIPTLAIIQSKAPRVSSTGVTVKEIEDYVLSLPGVSPQLAQQIRSMNAVNDPTSTLPLPIPINMASAQAVTVQGTQGQAIGDSTGIGSAVIWEKDGVIYAVGGTLPESQVLQIANSLQ